MKTRGFTCLYAPTNDIFSANNYNTKTTLKTAQLAANRGYFPYC